jgi:hypothetical protein
MKRGALSQVWYDKALSGSSQLASGVDMDIDSCMISA